MESYFWFICGVFVGCGNALFIWSRLNGQFQADKQEVEKLKRFCVGFAVAIIVPCFLLGLIELARGAWGEPDAPMFGVGNVFSALVLVVSVVSWVLLLLYVWVWNGAETLSKYRKGFNIFPRNALTIKLLITAVVVISACSMALQS